MNETITDFLVNASTDCCPGRPDPVLIQILLRIVLMSFAFAIGYGLWRLVEIPLRRWRESTFDYVYIDDNGNARELNADEEEYLTTALFLDDDADFVFKSHYESLNPNGKFRGYLRRRQLPREVSISAPTRHYQPITYK